MLFFQSFGCNELCSWACCTRLFLQPSARHSAAQHAVIAGPQQRSGGRCIHKTTHQSTHSSHCHKVQPAQHLCTQHRPGWQGMGALLCAHSHRLHLKMAMLPNVSLPHMFALLCAPFRFQPRQRHTNEKGQLFQSAKQCMVSHQLTSPLHHQAELDVETAVILCVGGVPCFLCCPALLLAPGTTQQHP